MYPFSHITWTSGEHYSDVIMGAMVSQITSITIVYSTVYSDADQRKTCPRHWTLCGEFTGDVEDVSIWWRHHWVWSIFLWLHRQTNYLVSWTVPNILSCHAWKACVRITLQVSYSFSSQMQSDGNYIEITMKPGFIHYLIRFNMKETSSC